MKRFASAMLTILLTTISLATPLKASAISQTQITRTQAEQRAESIINLSWTYSADINSTIDPAYSNLVTQASQLKNVTTAQMTGIPYNWGGLDGIDSVSYNTPWTNFLDAVSKGAYTGNVNTDAGYGYIKGTAGIDCSGYVQAVYNINDYKQSTSTLFNTYFTQINLADIKHMDILDHPGDHVVIFDKWGTLNGKNGAFTYESTPDQTYGGIQGTKHYFISMDEINKGYIPGRYINLINDTDMQPALPVALGTLAQVTACSNFRTGPSTSYSIITTIPKETIIYLNNYSNGWYQISYNGNTGWISGNLITSAPSGKYVSVNNVYLLNIRKGPSTSSYIIGVLSIDQYVPLIGISGDGNWYNINSNGLQGWVSSKYSKIITAN